MKKIIYVVVLIIFCLLLMLLLNHMNNISNNSNNSVEQEEAKLENEDGILQITDRLFVTQLDDIYLNPQNYEGKDIKIEGLMYSSTYVDITYNYVVRNTPGCCGNDGLAGLEIKYDGELPENDSWIKITGTIIMEEFSTIGKPVIEVKTIEIMEEKGQDFVM